MNPSPTSGYYTDAYFNFTRDLLLSEGLAPHVLMQVFQRKSALLCGTHDALGLLDGIPDLKVCYLPDGLNISPWEPVLTIEGDYTKFAHLETPLLGTLARQTLIATNVRNAKNAANGKPILFFPARHDDWRTQEIDGYAANIGGTMRVSTDAQASLWRGKGVGTFPHSLIAAYGGDTVAAAKAYADKYASKMDVTVLVDWDNDCAATAIAVANALRDDLYAVRLDTSASLVDKGVQRSHGVESNPALSGVCVSLVRLVRHALDAAGHERVKIVASGGFNVDKIASFEALDVPVDAYGVGSSLLRGSNDFTADIVEVDGKACAKVGRQKQDASRLIERYT